MIGSFCQPVIGGSADKEKSLALAGLARAHLRGRKNFAGVTLARELGCCRSTDYPYASSFVSERGEGRAEALRLRMLALAYSDMPRERQPAFLAPFCLLLVKAEADKSTLHFKAEVWEVARAANANVIDEVG